MWDEAASAALSQKSSEIEEPIHGQVEYINFPLNKRVEITTDPTNGTLRRRTGYIHSANIGTDQYWIVLDDPIVFDESGTARQADHVKVNSAGFQYLEEEGRSRGAIKAKGKMVTGIKPENALR